MTARPAVGPYYLGRTEIRVGERWTFTIEGTVVALLGTGGTPDSLRVETEHEEYGGELATIHALYPHAIKRAEQMPDPEPNWQVGDLALDRDDQVMRCTHAEHFPGGRSEAREWAIANTDIVISDSQVARPLRVLQPVRVYPGWRRSAPVTQQEAPHA